MRCRSSRNFWFRALVDLPRLQGEFCLEHPSSMPSPQKVRPFRRFWYLGVLGFGVVVSGLGPMPFNESPKASRPGHGVGAANPKHSNLHSRLRVLGFRV